MTDPSSSSKTGTTPATDADKTANPQAQPSYSKPTIRKYNQIVQVKPYGPSEKEAG